MSIFFRKAEPEQRSVTFQDVWGAGSSASSELTSSSLISVYAAHRLIIDAVVATPIHAYTCSLDGVDERMPSEPSILTPPWGTREGWLSQCVSSLLSDGNAFGLVTERAAGWPTSVLWVDPRLVTISETYNAPPVYFYNGVQLNVGEFIHIPWIVRPHSVRGLSPLQAFAESLSLGVNAQQTFSDWFENGAVPSGHLKSDRPLGSPDDARRAKQNFKSVIRGRDVLVTGADWSYTPIGIPADQAMFVDALKLTATQVATIYGIPPEEIGGDTGSSMTYSTIESNERRIATRVLRPWTTRIERALSELLPDPMYVEFNLDATVRAELLARMQAHEIGIRSGVLTVDEARALENRPPLTPEQKDDLKASKAQQQPVQQVADPTQKDLVK